MSVILLIVVGGLASGQMKIGEDQGGKEWLILGDVQVERVDAMEEAIDLKNALEAEGKVRGTGPPALPLPARRDRGVRAGGAGRSPGRPGRAAPAAPDLPRAAPPRR